MRFSAPDSRAQAIDIGIDGVDAFTQSTDRVLGYWLLTKDRGFLVTVTGSLRPSEAEIIAMMKSLFD